MNTVTKREIVITIEDVLSGEEKDIYSAVCEALTPLNTVRRFSVVVHEKEVAVPTKKPPSPEITIHPSEFKALKDAKTLEEILCLASLIASGKFSPTATAKEANTVGGMYDGCYGCPLTEVCLACIINE